MIKDDPNYYDNYIIFISIALTCTKINYYTVNSNLLVLSLENDKINTKN